MPSQGEGGGGKGADFDAIKNVRVEQAEAEKFKADMGKENFAQ